MLGFRGILLCTFRTTQHAVASHGAFTCTSAGTLLGKCTERLEKGQAEAARPTRAAGWPHLFLAVPLKAVRAARGRCWSSAGGHGLFPGPTRKRRGVRAAAPPDPASQRMPVSETPPWGQRAGWGKEENLPEETTAGVRGVAGGPSRGVSHGGGCPGLRGFREAAGVGGASSHSPQTGLGPPRGQIKDP